jgi:hypothetical protein
MLLSGYPDRWVPTAHAGDTGALGSACQRSY